MKTITTIWKEFKMFMVRDWSKTEKGLLLLNVMLFGMILGFFIAPIKKGIQCGNYSGNTYGNPIEESWSDEDEAR